MSADGINKVGRHHLNADGPFYVIDGACICCMMPEHEAPELMGFDEKGSHCYFRRQPETREEFEHAVAAMRSSCTEGLRYAGDDPRVLGRLRDVKSLCDEYGVQPSTWRRKPEGVEDSPAEVERRGCRRTAVDFFRRK